MTFATAVGRCEPIRQAYRKGMEAVRRRDRGRIRAQDPQRLRGSVDLDRALSRSHPDQPRWDYAVAYQPRSPGETVHWVEVHPASSSHVDEVLAKLIWLRGWLREEAPVLGHMRAKFIWVATGTVALQAGSPQRKRLAAEGLVLSGQHYLVAS